MSKVKINNVVNKARIIASIIFLFLLVIFARPTLHFFLIGLVFVVVGSILRIWASGYIYKMEKLAKCGPYAYVRNPLYFGSFLIGIGFCFLSGILYTLLFLPFLYWLFYYPMIKEEENALSYVFNEEYKEYCRKTPRFLPSFLKLILHPKPTCEDFSWKQVVVNREFQQIFYILLLAGIIGVKIFL